MRKFLTALAVLLALAAPANAQFKPPEQRPRAGNVVTTTKQNLFLVPQTFYSTLTVGGLATFNGGATSGKYLLSGAGITCASTLGLVSRSSTTLALCENNLNDQSYWLFSQGAITGVTNGQQIILNGGTAANPSFQIHSAGVANGIYDNGSGGGNLQVSTNGNLSAQFYPGQVIGAPSFGTGSTNVTAAGFKILSSCCWTDYVSAGTTASNVIGYGAFAFNAGTGGTLSSWAHSRNAAVGSHTALQAGDTMGTLDFEGSDGAKFVSSVQVLTTVEGTVATGKVGGRLSIQTAPAATGTEVEAFRVDSKQHTSYGGGAATAPSVSSCGSTPSGSVDSKATDISGTVTIGGGATSCTITFANAFATYDHCEVLSQTAGTFGYTYTLSAISLTGVTAARLYDYRCEGI